LLKLIFPEIDLIELWGKSPLPDRQPPPSNAVITHQRAFTGGDQGHAVMQQRTASITQPDVMTRQQAYKEGMRELRELVGEGMRDVEREIEELTKVKSFGQGHVFLILGGQGTGKTELCGLLPKIIFGAGYGTAINAFSITDRNQPSTETTDGIWVVDEIEALIDLPGFSDNLRRSYAAAVKRNPKTVLVIAGDRKIERKIESKHEQGWFGYSTVHPVILPQFTSEDVRNLAVLFVKKNGALKIDDRALDRLVECVNGEREKYTRGRQSEADFNAVAKLRSYLDRAAEIAADAKRKHITAEDFKDNL